MTGWRDWAALVRATPVDLGPLANLNQRADLGCLQA